MKRILWLSMVTVLLLLAVVACQAGPAASPKVTDTSTPKPTAAPATKIKLAFNNYYTAGIGVDEAKIFLEQLKLISGGEIEPVMTLGESVLKQSEHLTGLKNGIFDMALAYPVYHASQIPAGNVEVGIPGALRTADEWWAANYKRGLDELMKPEYAKFNVERIWSWSHIGGGWVSRVPLTGPESFKGVKFRAPGSRAKAYEKMGASTTYFPAGEVYTSLATGLIDGTTYSSPATNFSMGFHEVAKYWVLPVSSPTDGNILLANKDFWNKLPEKYRATIRTLAVDMGNYDSQISWLSSQDAIVKAKAAGVTIHYWTTEQVNVWADAVISTMPATTDPVEQKARQIIFDFAKDLGYMK